MTSKSAEVAERAGHTPGPWYLEVTDTALWIGVEKAAGGKVGDVITRLEYGDDYNPWHNDVALANARLIVVAPEMMEALDYIGGLSRALRQGGPDPIDLQGLSDALNEAVDLANSLVAKAEGRS